MQITLGGAIMMAAMLIVWVFAALVANDSGCRIAETSDSMSGPTKMFTEFVLLCWLR